MEHQILARKYRPKTFSQVLGQDDILKILEYSLDNNKYHNCYLLSGSRGTGKTTLGRLISKSLNCIEGVKFNFCQKCENCTEIDKGISVDLIEMDAASRTRVEDMKDILDNSLYPPSKGRYKVFLIDEVHMLSKHSFNALLKTLEEPPQYIKFILATTEPEKLPATIISRCMHLVLKNIENKFIVKNLEEILSLEKINYEKEALDLIADLAGYGMRDALNLVEQMVLYGKNSIKLEDTKKVLGLTDESLKVKVINSLLSFNKDESLNVLKELRLKNINYKILIRDINKYLYFLMLINEFGQKSLDDGVTDLEKMSLKNINQEIDSNSLQLFYQITLKSLEDLDKSLNPRVGFEVAVMRSLSFNLLSLDENNEKPTSNSINENKVEPIIKNQPIMQDSKVEDNFQDSNTNKSYTKIMHNEKVQTNESKEKTKITESESKGELDASLFQIEWSEIIEKLDLSPGFSLQLAIRLVLNKVDNNTLFFSINKEESLLLKDDIKNDLKEKLSDYAKQNIEIDIKEVDNLEQATPWEKLKANEELKNKNLEKKIMNDENLSKMSKDFGIKNFKKEVI